MHRRWLSLPLLSSCVSAFYPYHEGGDDHKSKRFYPILPQDLKSADDGQLLSLDVKKLPVTKRDNTYPVVLSSKPDLPNAMAIDQDGADFSYFSSVKFGSKEQEMYMLIDTGSSNTWLMGSSCASEACKKHNTFGSADSTSLNVTKDSWSLTYGTGEVQGALASDTVSFANFSIELGFGLASTASDDFDYYPMDGILGLGRPSSDELGTPTVMQVLNGHKLLKQNVIGMHLQRAADGTKDGEITFGGIDTSKFTGKLTYTNTVNAANWEIAADDAGVDGTSCNFTGKSAIIDSGTSYVLMPLLDAQAIHALIPGSAHTGEQFTVPCGSTAVVSFSFSGSVFNVSPKDYVGKANGNVCNSNIIGHQAFGPNQWILGDVFLKNVYTVFDFDENRIGFGTMSGNTAASSSSSTSTSAASSSSSTKGSSTSTAQPKSSSTTSTTSSTSSSKPSTTSTSGGDSSPFGGSSDTSIGTQTDVHVGLVMLLAFILGVLI